MVVTSELLPQLVASSIECTHHALHTQRCSRRLHVRICPRLRPFCLLFCHLTSSTLYYMFSGNSSVTPSLFPPWSRLGFTPVSSTMQIPTPSIRHPTTATTGLGLSSLDAGLSLFHQNWFRLLSGASCQPAIRHSRFDRRCTHNVRPVGWTCDQPGAPQNQADCKHELVSSILYLCNYFFAPTTTSGSTNYP